MPSDQALPVDTIDAWLREVILDFPENTELALCYISGGQDHFSGYQHREGGVLRTDPREKVFEIGSITKVFTSVLLAQMVMEGKLELNEPIWPWVDTVPAEPAPVTFAMLANHRSGMSRVPFNFLAASFRDPKNPYSVYDRKMLLECLASPGLIQSEPGMKYEYSNLGSGLLGYLVSRVEGGVPLTGLFEDKIFAPLGMVRSYGDCQAATEGLVPGVDPSGRPAGNWDFDVLAGAGSICSTAGDLAQFVHAFLKQDDPALSLTLRQSHPSDEGSPVGLAWHIAEGPGGTSWYWHNGGTAGYTSCMVIDLVTQSAVILLSNISALNAKKGEVDRLCFRVMRSLH